MKKLLCILLALAMLFSLAACAGETAPAGDNQSAAPSGSDNASDGDDSAADAPSDDGGSDDAAPSGSGNVAVPEDDSKVYIGVVKYMTGDNQTIGQYYKEGADMAVEEINAAGGILGKQIELVYIDEGDATIDATVNAMSYVLEDERLSAMLFGYMTSNCVAAVELLDNAEKPIPALFGNSGKPFSIDGIHEYAWQTRQLDGSGGVERVYAIRDLAEAEGIDMQTVVIFAPDTSVALDTVVDWEACFEEAGYDIPEEQIVVHSNNDTNLVPYAAQVKALDPDVIILNGDSPYMARAVVALDEAGCNEPGIIRFGNASVASNVVIDNGGKSADGWYALADWTPSLNTEISQTFAKNFEERYGKQSSNVEVVAYDQVYLLKHAMEQAGTTTDREAIHDALDNISNLELVMGTYNSNNNRHSFLSKWYMIQIQDGYIQHVGDMPFVDIVGAG